MIRFSLTSRSVALGIPLLVCAVAGVIAARTSVRAQSGPAPMIVDGEFDQNVTNRMLRLVESPRGWCESRKDGKLGRAQLVLSKKPIGGNATKKAMLKGNPKANAYLSQALRETQKGPFTLQWDIYVKSIAVPPNRSCFQMIGNDGVKGRGPNATGAERFVFLAFENAATAGKINLVAMEDGTTPGMPKSRVLVPDLSLKKWYTVKVDVDPAAGSYRVSVAGVAAAPVAVKAFKPKDKPTPKELTHVSFATWNDGPGVFYIDNVK
jgi:hypothetical protein